MSLSKIFLTFFCALDLDLHLRAVGSCCVAGVGSFRVMCMHGGSLVGMGTYATLYLSFFFSQKRFCNYIPSEH